MVENKIYAWIIIVIFAVIFGYCVISNKRYQTLEQQYQELLLKDTPVVDSLLKENSERESTIKELQCEIIRLNSSIDSLKHTKVDLNTQKNDFVISQSISESTMLLKKNLYEMNN